jgi:uncharacterized protein (TIGR03067 family)
MKYQFSTALLLAVLIPAAALGGQDIEKDLDKLQGTWVLMAMEKNGNAAPEFVLGKLTVTFKGDTMAMDGPLLTVKGKEAVKPEFTIKLDPSKKPKAIDATPLNGKFEGKTVLGIYQLEGDELKMCLPKQGDKERPSDFKSPEGSDLAFMTFKRSKK